MQTATAKQLTTEEPVMPEPDDELPDLIMPQNQESAVTGEVLAEVAEEMEVQTVPEQVKSHIDMDWQLEAISQQKRRWNILTCALQLE